MPRDSSMKVKPNLSKKSKSTTKKTTKSKISTKRLYRKIKGGVRPIKNITNLPFFTLSDSYKITHQLMYVGADKLVAYGECRGPHKLLQKVDKEDNRIINFGLRYIIDNYINRLITQEDVNDIKEFLSTHGLFGQQFPYNEKLFNDLVNKYPPVKIYGLEEGTVMLPHTPVYMIVADDPKYNAMVTFFETILTMVWYPISVATLSRACRDLFEKKFIKCELIKHLPWAAGQLLDFGYRGSSSLETSVIGGMAHLLNSDGSDTMSASYYSQYVYNSGKPIATTVPASEHSVMTSYKKEVDAMVNLFVKFGGNVIENVTVKVNDGTKDYYILDGDMQSPISIVMDSYNYENSLLKIFPAAVKKFIQLRKLGHAVVPNLVSQAIQNVIKKNTGGSQKGGLIEPQEVYKIGEFEKNNMNELKKLFNWNDDGNPLISYEDQTHLPKGFNIVFRPDSGNPTLAVLQGLVAGVHIFGIQSMEDENPAFPAFGKPTKGKDDIYFIKPRHIRVLQADGIDITTISSVLDAVTDPECIGSKNIAFNPISLLFGMGGGLLQKVDRGTTDFATKLCYVKYSDGESKNVMKDPATDPKKRSLPGLFKVINDNGKPTVKDVKDIGELDETDNMLKLLYDGITNVDNQYNFPKGLYTEPIKEKDRKPYFNYLKDKINDEWKTMDKYKSQNALTKEITDKQETTANTETKDAQGIDHLNIDMTNDNKDFTLFKLFKYNSVLVGEKNKATTSPEEKIELIKKVNDLSYEEVKRLYNTQPTQPQSTETQPTETQATQTQPTKTQPTETQATQPERTETQIPRRTTTLKDDSRIQAIKLRLESSKAREAKGPIFPGTRGGKKKASKAKRATSPKPGKKVESKAKRATSPAKKRSSKKH